MSTQNPPPIILPSPTAGIELAQPKVSSKNTSDSPEQAFSELLDSKQPKPAQENPKTLKKGAVKNEPTQVADKPKVAKKAEAKEEPKAKKQVKEEQPSVPLSSSAQKASIQSQKQIKQADIEKTEGADEKKVQSKATSVPQKFAIKKATEAPKVEQPTEVNTKPVKKGAVDPKAVSKLQPAKVESGDAAKPEVKAKPTKEVVQKMPVTTKPVDSEALKGQKVEEEVIDAKPVKNGQKVTAKNPVAQAKQVTELDASNEAKSPVKATQPSTKKAVKKTGIEEADETSPKLKTKALAAKNQRTPANISAGNSSADYKFRFEPINRASIDSKIIDNQLVKEFEGEIGTPSAKQSIKIPSMLTKEQTMDDRKSLKVALDGVPAPKVQTPVSRVESSPEMGNGDFLRRDDFNQKRQDAQYRQWATEVGEVKSNAQSATQSQFIDRSVSSQLSAGVVNQILNHIERMRDSEKSRMRFIMGSEDSNRLSVEIRVVGGSIHAKFEGDESVLNDLREQWRDIKDRAAVKGIELDEPEYISYALSGKGTRLFSASDAYDEEKSQSVIQQNNQPVRPGFKTAAAESSSPVHSFA